MGRTAFVLVLTGALLGADEAPPPNPEPAPPPKNFTPPPADPLNPLPATPRLPPGTYISDGSDGYPAGTVYVVEPEALPIPPAGLPRRGWYTDLEFTVLGPFLNGQLAPQPADNARLGGNFPLWRATLNGTVAPEIAVGWRADNGLGFRASYRSIATDSYTGNPYDSTVYDPTSGTSFASRLDVNVIDLDFTGAPVEFWTRWRASWLAGVRWASVYMDDLAAGPVFTQHASSFFSGAGPHFGAGLEYFFRPRMSIYTRADGAVLVGHVKQTFSTAYDDGTVSCFDQVGQSTTRAVPVVRAQVGMSWYPWPERRYSVFQFGYQFEQWWAVGTAGASTTDLTTHGAFFRWQIQF
jgi:hypothetical protein